VEAKGGVAESALWVGFKKWHKRLSVLGARGCLTGKKVLQILGYFTFA
jgi:hypothetical protein